MSRLRVHLAGDAVVEHPAEAAQPLGERVGGEVRLGPQQGDRVGRAVAGAGEGRPVRLLRHGRHGHGGDEDRVVERPARRVEGDDQLGERQLLVPARRRGRLHRGERSLRRDR
ncbi:MAG TPA: hypothetical protein VE781_10705, partial [Kineosporiaceae bacterium]|nr:hypothetical protein [Kineosporiaceae bacterium]